MNEIKMRKRKKNCCNYEITAEKKWFAENGEPFDVKCEAAAKEENKNSN